MAGSVLGEVFKVSTWGESHGAGVGVVVDGCPAGIELCEEDIQRCLNRRKPGETKYSTPRKEGDVVRIMSGVFEGKTTGTPISLVVENTSQRSADYSEIANYYRPGHADYTFDAKYNNQESRTDLHPVFPEGKLEEVRADAVKIFKALDGFGCARVDFFMEKDTNEVVFNEINTMPGFTSISMYPMLWNEKGLDNGKMVDEMIRLAFERYAR